MILSPAAGSTKGGKNGITRRSTSSDDDSLSSRTPSPAPGATGHLMVSPSKALETDKRKDVAPERDFRFAYNWRVAIALLPSLWIVLAHAGYYAQLLALLGYVATFTLDASQFAREHALVSVWFTVFFIGIMLWVSFVNAIRISPWNLLLAHNMTQILFHIGLWGALQFPWIWRENPSISRLMERLLIGISPVPCFVLICWRFAEAYGSVKGAFLASPALMIVYAAVSVPLTRSESRSRSNLFITGTLEKTFHLFSVCALPALMVVSAKRHSQDSTDLIAATCTLLTAPFLMVYCIPFAHIRTTFHFHLDIMRAGAVSSFVSATAWLLRQPIKDVSSFDERGLFLLDERTRDRILFCLVIIPLTAPLLEKLSIASVALVLIAFFSFQLISLPRHVLSLAIPLDIAIVLLVSLNFVGAPRTASESNHSIQVKDKGWREGEDNPYQQVNKAHLALIAVLGLAVAADCSSDVWMFVTVAMLILSSSLYAGLRVQNNIMLPRLDAIAKRGLVISCVLFEVVFLQNLPFVYSFFVPFSSLGVFALKLRPGLVLKLLSELWRVDISTRKGTDRKRLQKLTRLVNYIASSDEFLLGLAFIGRCLGIAGGLRLATVGMFNLGFASIADVSSLRTVIMQGILQLAITILVLQRSGDEVLLVTVLVLLTFLVRVSQDREKRQTSLEGKVSKSLVLMVPLASHLIVRLYGHSKTVATKEDYILLGSLAIFGIIAALTDVIGDFVFPIATLSLLLLSHRSASMVLFASSMAASIIVVSINKKAKIASLLVFMICQAFSLAFERHEVDSRLDSCQLILLLIILSHGCYAKSCHYASLGFDQDAREEEYISFLCVILYLFEAFFGLLVNRLWPFELMPLLVLPMWSRIGSIEGNLRLGTHITYVLWCIETAIELLDADYLSYEHATRFARPLYLTALMVTIEMRRRLHHGAIGPQAYDGDNLILVPAIIVAIITSQTRTDGCLALWPLLILLGPWLIVRLKWIFLPQAITDERRRHLPAL